MTESSLDLGNLFGAVAKNLLANQSELNKADTYNNDHGNNITQAFQIITQAVQASGQTPVSTQILTNASTALQQQANTGSAPVLCPGFDPGSQSVTGPAVTDSRQYDDIASPRC